MSTRNLAFVFGLAVLGAVHGYQLEIAPNDTCLARGNGTCFNLHDILSYPVSFTAPGSSPDVYKYWWDPCSGVKCYDSPNTIAVCQLADQLYSCGLLQPVWFWNGVYSPSQGRTPSIQILYPNGDTWRNTYVNITLNPNRTTPLVEFRGEIPYLQYNIYIETNDIGIRGGDFPCF